MYYRPRGYVLCFSPFLILIFCIFFFPRSKFGSRIRDRNWRRSWKTASFPPITAPAPATQWPATLHSPPPFGTHRWLPGPTIYRFRTSTRRHLAFWRTPGHGTRLRPVGRWILIFRPPTHYSTHWLLERGRYTEFLMFIEILFFFPSMGLMLNFQRNMQCIWLQS